MGLFRKNDGTLKYARKVVVFVIGTTVVLVGILLIVTPGPAFIVIPAGLAILGTEFLWARRFLRRIKREVISLTSSSSDPHR